MTPFDTETRLLLVGDIYVDAHTDLGCVRLGGAFHAARALHAVGVTYGVAFLAPSYLHEDVATFLAKLHCAAFASVGEVNGAPGVVIVRESKEAGDIGYEDLLRNARRVDWDEKAFTAVVKQFAPTDVLIFPGVYTLDSVIAVSRAAHARVHLDGQYLPSTLDDVARLSPLDTLFLSAPCAALELAGSNPHQLWRSVSSYVTRLVLKENRGGSQAFFRDGHAEAPSFPTRTAHSIGVGDCFDALVLAAPSADSLDRTLKRAAYYSSCYASTFEHDVFADEIAQAMKMDTSVTALKGTRISWEERPSRHIYLAAPDFPDVDTTKLDALEAALRYHNFCPHRPIKENGLAVIGGDMAHQRSLFRADIELIDRCALLIAVPLTPDPGTFAELGYFSALPRPTILYEATAPVSNLFARNSAARVCRTLGEVIDSLFELLG